MCNHLNPPLRFTNPCATFSRVTKLEKRADQTERLQVGNKRRHKVYFFPQAPSARLSEHLLKCPLKQ